MSEKFPVLEKIVPVKKPIFGMVHFPALPGTPMYESSGGLGKVRDIALRDAENLAEAGFDGFMFSNEGDRPYLADVSKYTVAIMARLVSEIAGRFKKPFGVSVLADPMAAISVGAAVESSFVRIFLSWVYASDWGIVSPDAGALQRYRAQFSPAPAVFANVSGHTAPLGDRSIYDITRGAIKFGLADAVCLAGTTAGSEIDVSEIRQARDAAHGATPVVIGTGVSVANIEKMYDLGDAFIVGTSLKENGDTFKPIDPVRARAFMEKIKAMRR
ncbi:MAG TPA: BtpA/SgcQ family protein [Rectinemataceae bacterium]|nr:BtpA/SgcQ family protein [Rectinemataceae bacterium]